MPTAPTRAPDVVPMSTAPTSLRLFIAVKLSESLHSTLADVQQRVQQCDSHHAMRWVANDSLHLTLKFLGEAPTDHVGTITAAMQAASTQSPFTLHLERLGAFPDLCAPRVVWIGVTGDVPAVHHLRDSVERTVSALGFPTEARPFSPHLTLGRARPNLPKAALAAVGAELNKLTIERIGSWQVADFVLMRSDLSPHGAVYSVVSQVTLS